MSFLIAVAGLATVCSVTAVVRPHTVPPAPSSLFLHQQCHDCSHRLKWRSTDLITPPQVTNIPSVFTKPSSWSQIHCVVRQIATPWPHTPTQGLHILAPDCFVFFLPFLPNSSSIHTCQVETGCEKCLCFSMEPQGSELRFIAPWLNINKTDQ